MVLQGTEIKSIRNSRINLKDGFIRVRNGETFLHNVHISHMNKEIFLIMIRCARKVIITQKQIIRLENELKNTGITVVPLKVYIRNGYARY